MYTFSRTKRQDIVPVPGQRIYSKLLNNVQTHFLDLTVSGQLDVTVAGTAVLNRGSLLAAFDFCGIDDGGDIPVIQDPRVARFYSEAAALSSLTTARAANANVQAGTILKEQFRLYFAHPYAGLPRETAFMEHYIKTELRAFFDQKLAAGGVGRIIQGGTATLTNVKVEVQQGYDADEQNLPLLRLQVRQIVKNVAGAQPQFEIPIITQNRIRAIVVTQDTTGLGEVPDIINTVQVRGDKKFWIVDPIEWDKIARDQEQEFGGDVYGGPKGAHVLFNYQQFGRLSNLLFPAQQDSNFRFVFDCQPSAQAGAGSSNIIITLFELVRDNFVDPTSGRRVVAPTLPFTN